MADCVRNSSPAACVKLSVRAAASKLLRSSRGGRSAAADSGFAFSKRMQRVPNDRMTLGRLMTIFILTVNAKESAMNTQRLSLSLPKKAIFTLPDAHDVDIECQSGTVWITLDDDQ